MGLPFRVCATASLLILAVSCTTTTEITLPTLDASETMTTRALVVQAEYWQGFDAPSNVIRGSGEGATRAMGEYMQSAGPDGSILLMFVLAPIALPIAASVGAGMAHSEEEVDAAVSAFQEIGQDRELLASIDRRFIEALDEPTAEPWACIEAVSEASPQPCRGYTPVARLSIRPVFRLQVEGEYSPEIHLFGDVVASLSIEFAALNSGTDVVLEAKWAYYEQLGEFFDLAKDDATLLRSKLDDILDRFATRIAEDLYLDPRSKTISRKRKPDGFSFIDVPEGVVVRIAQGTDVPSITTHGEVWPHGGGWSEKCWIVSIDGKPTGHSYSTNRFDREVTVKAGRVKLDVSCVRHRGSINEKLEHHSIEIPVESGASYATDGRDYRRMKSCQPSSEGYLCDRQYLPQ